METPTATLDDKGRPIQFKMEIQGSLLEALGVNLYSSIGKCLVEFAANAFDSDSAAIDITIPFDGIKHEREQIRAKAKERVQTGAKGKPLVVLDPLPPEISIVIEDKGHGMRAQEIQDKFLPLNRNRRQGATDEESSRRELTESGKRRVMGRKGLGKLAAFGVAQQVTIYSKRVDDTYATEFTMDYDKIRQSPRLQEVPFTPIYHEGLDPALHGTRITLSRLRCDAVATGEGGAESVIRDNFFGIEATEFEIRINGNGLGPDKAKYEFVFPDERPLDDMSESLIELPGGLGSFRVQHRAMFRARGEEGKRNHLPGAKRGARFYCNGRLAAGPSLVDLHSGKHNFGATAYLEVIVRADELDALGVDLINTNRTDFRRDNDVVTELLNRITTFMEDALAAHSKFRDEQTERLLVDSEIGKQLEAQIVVLSKRTQTPARKLIRLLARHEGVDSEAFRATAPLVVQSVNSGEVLVKLLELSRRDTDLKEVIQELQKLAEIERSDALKLYRARKNALIALQGLIKKGDDTWKDNPQFENELHSLLDENPWLIREEIGRYVSSDHPLATMLQRIETHLKINRSAGAMDPATRPDQVFLLGDSNDLSTVIVVELKSPNIPLSSDHWTQLEKYVNEVEVFLGTETKRAIRVHGFLVGTPPPRDTRNSGESLLLKKWDAAGVGGQIDILSLSMLLDTAIAKNTAQLEILEKEDSAPTGA